MPKSSTLTTAYSYDSVGNLLTQASSGASDIAFSYSYNKNGYITGEVRTENGQTTESSYAYDALGQLTSFLQSTGYGEQYAYDKAGNMTEKVITPLHSESEEAQAVTLKMSYNKGNQLTAMANGKDKITYSYDKNGSMVQKVLSSQTYGKLTDTYAYNALDQLTEYVGYDGYQQQFTYDANGMRLSKSEAGDGNRSTLEELLRGNIAGLPEIVEPTQGQINADEADMPAGLEWATTEYLYDLTQEYYQVISETTMNANGTSATTAYAYTLSLFTSLDSLCSCSFLLHIGSGHTRLTDSVLIKFPLCWNWQNSDVITQIEKLFMELVKLFCPYWGCVANLGLTNEKKYVVDEMPTTLHWLNFFSESALKKIGPKKLQAIHSIPNCRIIDSNIIKTSSYPTTTVEENASHNLARLNSILLR